MSERCILDSPFLHPRPCRTSVPLLCPCHHHLFLEPLTGLPASKLSTSIQCQHRIKNSGRPNYLIQFRKPFMIWPLYPSLIIPSQTLLPPAPPLIQIYSSTQVPRQYTNTYLDLRSCYFSHLEYPILSRPNISGLFYQSLSCQIKHLIWEFFLVLPLSLCCIPLVWAVFYYNIYHTIIKPSNLRVL